MSRILILIIACVLSSAIQAAETSCASLVSNAWVGSFMIKTFPYCSEYKTCFHSAIMSITSTAANEYTLTLTPLDTASAPFMTVRHFTCQNNVAAVTDNVSANVSYTCEYGKCMLKYEDNRLVAAMLEVLG